MALNIKTFATLVSDQVTALQGAAAGLVDTAIGSILRSILESNSAVAIWIQQLIVNLLVTTRAATSSGDDLDSWMADFSFTRLAATAATGQVVFSRFTATNQAVIPVGTQVSTTDGSQAYLVTTDTTNAAYDPTLAGYLIAAGVTSVRVPVQAVTAGAAGNALEGTITVISGSVQYVDTVTNPVTFGTGEDAESDTDFRARFVLWIASLSKSTLSAIGYALSSMQNGVTYTLTENQTYSGLSQPGYFYAVVDDGSGAPSSTFLGQAYSAIDAVRGFTVTFGVFAPARVTANIAMTITLSAPAVRAEVVALVDAALEAYVAGLALGQTLPFTQLATIAYGASPYVTNVTGVMLNGSLADDLTATASQVIRAGTISVS
ncbi:MAG: baseplate J/gp47 family protein [Rouxiella badensis]|uniref:Baseplate protein n=1 Tax=Rouxiella badensis TaxID=1646377 RepID=A0A1X0WAG7_9GAMM|nr:baseplate J/gp47 family protein [Rouxiella badensis]ORJ23766.1 baseplate protein [Rouxiella badensis]QOI54805.1 baseplate J/gp47 family protein [Rouxiella badensis subsp. acadiensis]WAT04104.1 baseplate J/gp47 family protein [Rouxiella badensis]